MSTQKQQWDESYTNRDTFIYYPHEEIVRFISKYVRKRTGVTSFKDARDFGGAAKVLDLGCGQGRHVIYAHEMGLDPYGVDLSDKAIGDAREWAKRAGVAQPEERLKQGDIRHLPWADGFFDVVVSHGVLDSMHFAIACEAMQEAHRVLKPGAFFYCDLVSGDDSAHSREFAEEEVVEAGRERGTIQSYFNYAKILTLIGDRFEIAENFLIRKENLVKGGYISRYHLTLKKR